MSEFYFNVYWWLNINKVFAVSQCLVPILVCLSNMHCICVSLLYLLLYDLFVFWLICLMLTLYTCLLVDSSISRSVFLAKNSVQNQRLAYKSNLKNELNEKESRI